MKKIWLSKQACGAKVCRLWVRVELGNLKKKSRIFAIGSFLFKYRIYRLGCLLITGWENFKNQNEDLESLYD